jgi:hypothetical protein
MAYSKGVLIHNFNEDCYGVDLQNIPRRPEPPQCSVSQLVHHWKTPVPNSIEEAQATKEVPQYILFGHTGDMRDPHTNFQKREFSTANQYFLQDPANIKGPHSGVGTLTADNFTVTDKPLTSVAPVQVNAVAKKKEGWGDLRQSHSLPPDERFMTEHKRSFQATDDSGAEKGVSYFRPSEISGTLRQVRITRSVGGPGRGNNLRSAGASMAAAR